MAARRRLRCDSHRRGDCRPVAARWLRSRAFRLGAPGGGAVAAPRVPGSRAPARYSGARRSRLRPRPHGRELSQLNNGGKPLPRLDDQPLSSPHELPARQPLASSALRALARGLAAAGLDGWRHEYASRQPGSADLHHRIGSRGAGMGHAVPNPALALGRLRRPHCPQFYAECPSRRHHGRRVVASGRARRCRGSGAGHSRHRDRKTRRAPLTQAP